MDQEYRRGRDANISAAVIVAVIFHSQFSCTLFIPLIPFSFELCIHIDYRSSDWLILYICTTEGFGVDTDSNQFAMCSAQLKPSLPVTGWNYGVQKFQGCAALHYKVRKRQCWLVGVGCGND